MKIVPLTSELVDRVIPVYLDAFRGYPNTKLGAPYVRAFLSWFASYGKGVALVAIDDAGEVAGFVVGALLGYADSLIRDLLPLALRQTVLHPRVLLDARFWRTAKGRLTLIVAPSRMPKSFTAEALPKPIASLVAIGTSTRQRRTGVATALISAFEAAVRPLGAKTVRLSVYPDNDAARRAYERRGWSCEGLDVPPGTAIYYSKVLE